MSNETKKPSHIAYTVRETKNGNFFTRIGAVFAHGKGEGFTLQLAALPIDGKIVCFLPKQKPDGEEEPKVE
jgi:hypothetical protein